MTPAGRFLFELASSLRGPRRARRRLLLEIEHHIVDAVRAESAAGGELVRAEADVLARLGPAESIAARWNESQLQLRGIRRRGYAALAVALALAGALGLTQYASGQASPARSPRCQAGMRQLARAAVTCAPRFARLPH
jgi:hypothetical protein